MKTRSSFLFAYRQLLRLYPPGFRQRFAEEMFETAKAAQSSDWPLIIGDTGITIVRSWLLPDRIRSSNLAAVHGQYLSIGETPVRPLKLFQGLSVATILVLGACYISTLTVWHLPSYPDDRVCGRMPSKIERR
jgi:hypothetical protein